MACYWGKVGTKLGFKAGFILLLLLGKDEDNKLGLTLGNEVVTDAISNVVGDFIGYSMGANIGASIG